jgi:HEAT repeat protein
VPPERAARTLGQLRASEAREALEKAASDADVLVRKHARQALERIRKG